MIIQQYLRECSKRQLLDMIVKYKHMIDDNEPNDIDFTSSILAIRLIAEELIYRIDKKKI